MIVVSFVVIVRVYPGRCLYLKTEKRIIFCVKNRTLGSYIKTEIYIDIVLSYNSNSNNDNII